MTRHIDYYFTLQSTWAFIGHEAFHALVARHGVTVTYKPCRLRLVFDSSGGLAFKDRHPARRAYRTVEMQRWRDKRGLDFDIDPPFFPFDVSLADRMLVAIIASGGDPNPFSAGVYDALWRRGQNPADRATLAAIADRAGQDGAALADTAETDAIAALYQANTDEAIARRIIGSPAYVLDGEVFWGQDRLDLLDDALSTGRPAFLMPDDPD